MSRRKGTVRITIVNLILREVIEIHIGACPLQQGLSQFFQAKGKCQCLGIHDPDGKEISLG